MRHGRLQLHLDPSWLVRVKRFVRLGGGHQRLGLRENLCAIYRAAPHKVDQHGDIAAVVAIPHLDRQILVHRLPNGEGPCRLGIHTNDPQRTGFCQHLHTPGKRQ
jgi:hypothetical protein